MKCLDDHHHYELDGFENPVEGKQELRFVKKELAGNPVEPGELALIHDGTTNEEVLKVLIHRMQGLYDKFPSPETYNAIRLCTTALSELVNRTIDRERRGVEGKHLA